MGKAVAGIFGVEGGDKEAAAAARRFSRAEGLSDEQLARNKGYLEEWEKVFGLIQEAVASHLNELNPEVEASRQLAAFESEYTSSLDSINKNFDTRFGPGVTASGLKEANLINAKLNAARVRAAVKASAEDSVQQKKQQFLSVGLQQQAQLRSSLNQAFQHASGTSLNIGSQYQSTANQKDAAVAAFGQNLFNKVVGGGDEGDGIAAKAFEILKAGGGG